MAENERQQEPLLDTVAISKACLQHAEDWLIESGLKPTQAEIGRQFGVSGPRIHSIKKGEAFDFKSIWFYAQQRGLTFDRLLEELPVELGYAKPEPVNPIAIEPPSKSFLEAIRELIESVDELLSSTEDYEKCYRQTVEVVLDAARQAGVPLRSAAICVCDGENPRFYVPFREGKAGRADVHEIAMKAPKNVARHMVDWWHEWLENEKDVTSKVVVRPDVREKSESQRFWQEFAGSSDREGRQLLRLYNACAHIGVGEDRVGLSDVSIASVVFVSEERYIAPSDELQGMHLVRQLLKRIYSMELQKQAQSVARLAGVSPNRIEVEAHAKFYGKTDGEDKPRASVEALEWQVSSFLEAVCCDAENPHVFPVAEVWSYDWSCGKFVFLSRGFRYVCEKMHQIPREIVESKIPLVLAERFADVETRTPRPGGMTSLIMMTRRPAVMWRANSIHPELAAFLGMPITLYDSVLERRIWSVLFVGLRAKVYNPTAVVRRIGHWAETKGRNTTTAKTRVVDASCGMPLMAPVEVGPNPEANAPSMSFHFDGSREMEENKYAI